MFHMMSLVLHVAASPLAVRSFHDRLDVDLPRAVESQLPLTLGLFMQASLDLAASDGTSASLSCTAAAVAWHCLDNLGVTISLPQPEWRGTYVVMLVADSCAALAASASFEAGPLAAATVPRFHVPEVPQVPRSESTYRWWPAFLDRSCLEFGRWECPELTVHVNNRGEGAHEADALLLLPVSAAMATAVRGERDALRDVVRKFSAGMAAASNVLGSSSENATLRLASPVLRTTYVAVLLSGAQAEWPLVEVGSRVAEEGNNHGRTEHSIGRGEMLLLNSVVSGIEPQVVQLYEDLKAIYTDKGVRKALSDKIEKQGKGKVRDDTERPTNFFQVGNGG